MASDEWFARWREGRIGFHRESYHPFLVRYEARFPRGARIMVPLAGKTLDIHFLLEKGHSVVAVELVESAVAAFFSEAKLEPTITRFPRRAVYESPGLEFHAADLFDLEPASLGVIDGVYDRAALIALEPNLRQGYAEWVKSLLTEEAGLLTIGIRYEASQMSPPPYSVPEEELAALYDTFQLQVLEADDNFEHLPQLKERGLSALTEYAVWLSRDTSG